MKLQIRHATVQYAADIILPDVNFDIHDKEKIAIVGRNGCGKTTLLKLISGEITMSNPDSDEECCFNLAGGTNIGFLKQINFQDKDILVENEIKKVFSAIYECQERMRSVEKQLSERPDDEMLLKQYSTLQARWEALNGDSAEREMYIMFQQFGFSLDDLKRPIGSFSGGQQTKIAFIKLLLSHPDILLLDEPTNHLDLPAIEWLEGYLRNYPSAVVIVSHDRAFLDRIVTVTYEIEYGIIKRYSGNYSAFIAQKEEALAKQEKDYEAQQKEIKRLTEWIEKWKNTPTKVTAAYSKRKAIEHMVLVEKPRRFDTTTFKAHFEPNCVSYSEVLTARNLQIGYDDVLCEVSFKLMRGDRLAVIGENGKGKSTLLKTIMGIIPALGGSLEIGKNVEIGYFDQQRAVINDYDPEQTVLNNFWDEYPRLTNEQVRSTLGAFAFSQDEVEKKLGMLSGGERVRLALCKMFYTRPNLLILDEPTNHMDILGKESLEKMLKEYSGTVLFVSHDRYFVRKTATGILEFDGASVTQYNMSYDEYLEEKAKRTAAAAPVKSAAPAEKKAPVNNPGKIRSRLEHKLKKLEDALAESETRLAELKQELSDPALSSDYEKLLKIQGDIEAEETSQEDILEQILQCETELSEL